MKYRSQTMDIISYQNGRGIKGVVEYYYASTSDVQAEANLPSDLTQWKPNPGETGFDEINKYLWNREQIIYDDGNPEKPTNPAVIAVWSKDGKGIKSITEWYKLSQTEKDKPTTFPEKKDDIWQANGWSDSVLTPNATNRFLWNYQVIEYTEGDPTTSGPTCIGVHGDSAQDFNITASSYALIKDKDGKPKNSITLTVHLMNIDQQIQWKETGGNWGSATSTLTKTINAPGTYEAQTADGKWSDSVIITEVVDGATGKDAIAITLSNPTMTFHADTSGESENCEVIVYEGSETLGPVEYDNTTNKLKGKGFYIKDVNNCQISDDNKGMVKVSDQDTNGSATFTVIVQASDGTKTTKNFTINWTVVENGKDAVDYKIILTPNSVNLTTNPNQLITGQILQTQGSATPKDITGESLEANKVFFKYSGSGKADEEKWYLLETYQASWLYPNCSNVEIAFCLNKIDDDNRFPYLDESGKLVGTEDLPAEYDETKYIYYYATATASTDGASAIVVYCTAGSFEGYGKTIAKGKPTINKPDTNSLGDWSAIEPSRDESKGYEYKENYRPYIFKCNGIKETTGGTITYTWQEPTLYKAWNDLGLSDIEYAKFAEQTYYFTSDALAWTQGGDGEEGAKLYIKASEILVNDSNGKELFEAGGQKVEIGGWHVDKNSLYKDNVMLSTSDDKQYQSLITSDKSPIRIQVSENFRLLDDGSLYASAAQISGKIHATEGTIGGVTIGSHVIYSDYKPCTEKVTITQKFPDGSISIKDKTWVRNISTRVTDKVNSTLHAWFDDIERKIYYSGYTPNIYGEEMYIDYEISTTFKETRGIGSSTSGLYTTEEGDTTLIASYIECADSIQIDGGLICPSISCGKHQINLNSLKNTSMVTLKLSIVNDGTRIQIEASPSMPEGRKFQIRTTSTANPGGSTTRSEIYIGKGQTEGLSVPITFGTYTSAVFADSNLDFKTLYYTTDAITITGNVRPTGNYSLGTMDSKWANIYADNVNGQTKTLSDRNLKNTICDIPSEYDVIFDSLRPVTFKYNDGTSGRTHMGMIAQEVEDAVNRAGVSIDDFAAICVENGQYGLRYGEFVAMCINQIQKLKARMTAAEEKIAALELEISSLKSELENLKKS